MIFNGEEILPGFGVFVRCAAHHLATTYVLPCIGAWRSKALMRSCGASMDPNDPRIRSFPHVNTHFPSWHSARERTRS